MFNFVCVLLLCITTSLIKASVYRPIDGSGIAPNNRGRAGDTFARYGANNYVDGYSTPAPGVQARTLSNIFLADDPYEGYGMYETTLLPFETVLNGHDPDRELNQLVVGFGQAVVHDFQKNQLDLDFSALGNPDFFISNDDPLCQVIVLNSSAPADIIYFSCAQASIVDNGDGTKTVVQTGTEDYTVVSGADWHYESGPVSFTAASSDVVKRQWTFPLVSRMVPDDTNSSVVPVNQVTSFLDLSFIYGSDDDTNQRLRALDGSGELLTSEGDVPYNDVGVANDCGAFDNATAPTSASGDARVDVSVYLTAIHSLYFRAHNSDAKFLKALHPTWTDNQIFYRARDINIARYQRQVYEEYLPAVFGHDVHKYVGRYTGYKPNVSPNVDLASDIAFRVFHSQVMLPQTLFDENCDPIPIAGTLGFPSHSRPNCIFDSFRNAGGAQVLKSAITQPAQKVNGKVNDLMRNVVFRSGNNQGTPPLNLDIEMLNIIRAREFGLPDIDSLKKERLGSSVYDKSYCKKHDAEDSLRCFKRFTSNSTLAALLKDTFGKVNKIDTFIGFMLEDHSRSRQIGPTATKVILDQMKRSRDSDPYFYLNNDMLDFTLDEWLRTMESLSETIENQFGFSVPRNAFEVPNRRRRYCDF